MEKMQRDAGPAPGRRAAPAPAAVQAEQQETQPAPRPAGAAPTFQADAAEFRSKARRPGMLANQWVQEWTAEASAAAGQESEAAEATPSSTARSGAFDAGPAPKGYSTDRDKSSS